MHALPSSALTTGGLPQQTHACRSGIARQREMPGSFFPAPSLPKPVTTLALKSLGRCITHQPPLMQYVRGTSTPLPMDKECLLKVSFRQRVNKLWRIFSSNPKACFTIPFPWELLTSVNFIPRLYRTICGAFVHWRRSHTYSLSIIDIFTENRSLWPTVAEREFNRGG